MREFVTEPRTAAERARRYRQRQRGVRSQDAAKIPPGPKPGRVKASTTGAWQLAMHLQYQLGFLAGQDFTDAEFQQLTILATSIRALGEERK